MAQSFGTWVANHWRKGSGSFDNDALPVQLPSGLWAWKLNTNTTEFRIYGQMHKSYAGSNLTFSIIWTVPTGVSGNLNLGGNFRRFQYGSTAFLPESAGFGPGVQTAPSVYIPKEWTVTITQAQTAPLFPGGLGGIEAGENWYCKFTRSGGTTLTGDAYILAVEGYFA